MINGAPLRATNEEKWKLLKSAEGKVCKIVANHKYVHILHVLKPDTLFNFTKSCLDEKKGALFNCFTVHYYFWYALGQTQTRTVSNNALWQCVYQRGETQNRFGSKWTNRKHFNMFPLHKCTLYTCIKTQPWGALWSDICIVFILGLKWIKLHTIQGVEILDDNSKCL